MPVRVFVKSASFADVDREIRIILKGVDSGSYDQELRRNKIDHPDQLILPLLELSSGGQGMSPGEWMEVIAIFGPLAARITDAAAGRPARGPLVDRFERPEALDARLPVQVVPQALQRHPP